MRSMATMSQGSSYVNICTSDSSDVCKDWAWGGRLGRWAGGGRHWHAGAQRRPRQRAQ